MVERTVWRRADVIISILVTFGTLAACVALALSPEGLNAIIALIVSVCSRTYSEAVTHSLDLGRLALLTPFGLGLVLGVVEGLRLIYNTHHWISALSPTRCQPDKRLRRIAKRCGISQRLVLVTADRPLVFTQGLITPQVWLSTGLIRLLSREQLEAVLWHEAKHQAAADPLKILAARCLNRALFFVPVVRDLCQTYLIAKEIAADTHAAKMIGSRLPLASALTKMLSASAVPLPNAALTGNSIILEARLLTLLDPRRHLPIYPARRLGASLVWLTLLIVVFIAPSAAHVPSFNECFAPTATNLWAFWPL